MIFSVGKAVVRSELSFAGKQHEAYGLVELII
jgi:hypothetical protein